MGLKSDWIRLRGASARQAPLEGGFLPPFDGQRKTSLSLRTFTTGEGVVPIGFLGQFLLKDAFK